MAEYLLITPMKNEENTIERVIESVKKQSKLPYLWIIVNDASTDKSWQIAKENTNNLDWVHVLSKTINKEYNWLGYSKVIIEGIEYINQLSLNYKKSDIGYIGILDADITIEENYFENIIDYMEEYPEVARVSGEIYVKIKDKWNPENRGNNARGGATLYKLESLVQIGGFPKTASPDSISDMKLKIRRYSTKRLRDLKAFQHRKTLSKENILKGFFLHGRSGYLNNYHPVFIFAISLMTGVKNYPYVLSGILYLLGYISGFFSHEQRMKDEEVRGYTKFFWRYI